MHRPGHQAFADAADLPDAAPSPAPEKQACSTRHVRTTAIAACDAKLPSRGPQKATRRSLKWRARTIARSPVELQNQCTSIIDSCLNVDRVLWQQTVEVACVVRFAGRCKPSMCASSSGMSAFLPANQLRMSAVKRGGRRAISAVVLMRAFKFNVQASRRSGHSGQALIFESYDLLGMRLSSTYIPLLADTAQGRLLRLRRRLPDNWRDNQSTQRPGCRHLIQQRIAADDVLTNRRYSE